MTNLNLWLTIVPYSLYARTEGRIGTTHGKIAEVRLNQYLGQGILQVYLCPQLWSTKFWVEWKNQCTCSMWLNSRSWGKMHTPLLTVASTVESTAVIGAFLDCQIRGTSSYMQLSSSKYEEQFTWCNFGEMPVSLKRKFLISLIILFLRTDKEVNVHQL